MITERIGGFTIRFPWIGILLILIVTGASITLQILKPMEESFDQEDFMPDMKVAIANSEYQDKFTSTYSYLILVRSEYGDVVTKQSFMDMTELSERIIVDPT